MPDELEDVQAAEVSEVKAPPVPEASEASSDEGSSSGGLTVEDLKAFRQELNKDFDERVRQFQSGVDKRLSGYGNLSQLLKRAGVPVNPEALAAAQREMELDEVLEERRQGPSVRGRTDDSREVFQVVSAEILDQAGIAYDDADYKAFVAKHSGRVKDPEHWRTLMKVFTDRKGRQAAAPNPAAAVAESRTNQPTKAAESEEELRAELASLLKKSPSDPTVLARRVEIAAQLKPMSVAEARRKGLDPLA